MYDLIVIGGGFWGTATALYAKDMGLKNILVIDDDDSQGGSRNAACMIDLRSYKNEIVRNLMPDDWKFPDIVESMEWLNSKVKLSCGAYFSSYMNARKRFRSYVYSMSKPSSFLNLASQFKIVDTVTEFRKRYSGGWILRADHIEFDTKALIIAAGYKTDELLINSGYPPLNVEGMRGTALIIKREESDGPMDMPLIHNFRPYVDFTLRTYGDNYPDGELRFGDTTPRIEKNNYMSSCLTKMIKRDFEVKRELVGYRPFIRSGKMAVKKLDENLVVICGGQRVGLALSGLVAKKAMSLLNK